MSRLTQIFNALARDAGARVLPFNQTTFLADTIPGRGGHCAALIIAWLARHDPAPGPGPFAGQSFANLVTTRPQTFSSVLRQVQNSERSRAEIFRNIKASGPPTPERLRAVEDLMMTTSPSALLRDYLPAFGGVACTVDQGARYGPPFYSLASSVFSDNGRHTINTHNHSMGLVVQNGEAWFFDPNCGIAHFGPHAGAAARGPGTTAMVLAARFLRDYLSAPYVSTFYQCSDGVWLVSATPAAPAPAASASPAAAAASSSGFGRRDAPLRR